MARKKRLENGSEKPDAAQRFFVHRKKENYFPQRNLRIDAIELNFIGISSKNLTAYIQDFVSCTVDFYVHYFLAKRVIEKFIA